MKTDSNKFTREVGCEFGRIERKSMPEELDLRAGFLEVRQRAGGSGLQVYIEECVHIGGGDGESSAGVKATAEKSYELDDKAALQKDLIAEAEVIGAANHEK